MIYLLLVLLGLCLGSFVNALVWRVHEQSKENSKKNYKKADLANLSVVNGRSICPKCKHVLGVKDLVPVFSWLALMGKCRYCHKSISWQYPAVELATAALFLASYIWWPFILSGSQIAIFALWLLILVGLVSLFTYDLHWTLLPNRIIYPFIVLAFIMALISIFTSVDHVRAFVNELLAVIIGGGIFYVLFELSDGKWIGGGDVKLGWLLGLTVGSAGKAILFIFIAAVLGSIISLSLIALKRLKRTSIIPFGPFLIIGAFISLLFGSSIIQWYQRVFLSF